MTDHLIATTRYGQVEGADFGGVRRWLGVPYAQGRRFDAPSPPENWSGVRAAKAYAPQCAQGMMKKVFAEGPDYGEDCLAINIWSPPADGKLRPVLFWIHGGAFMGGSSNHYHGQELAKRGDMVVVTINYRVGVLGFVNFGEVLGLPSIPSNLGLRDQIAALKWVHDNIAAFGGDPARVTISGQSAGSMSVSLLMLAPQAWPYFHSAIMQSGAASLIHDREMSIKTARIYAEHLDLNQGDLEKLQKLDVKTLLDAQTHVQAHVDLTIPSAPWYDGDLLPASLKEAHRAPQAAVPLIAGYAREETRLFDLMPGPDILPAKRKDIESILRAQLPASHADRVLAAYPQTEAGRVALATDLAFGMPTRNFAERQAQTQPTWFYRFDLSHPIAGAAHGIDLLYMWPFTGWLGIALRGGFYTGRRRGLSETFKDHLIHFVHERRPKPDWPAYTPQRRETLIFNLGNTLEQDPNSARRLAWAGADVGPGITEAYA